MFSKIEILFEDESVIALSKPSGLMVHADGRSDDPTLVDWLKNERPEIADVGEKMSVSDGENNLIIERPGIVHRLDKETSGVILVAKTQPAFLFLKRQFMSREVKKRYHAFVYGALRSDRGTIDRPIGRSTVDFRKYSAASETKGESRDAVTRWHTLLKGKTATFIEVEPLSGRTHQIRVHMKAVGHPVVSDVLYAPGREPLLGFTRLALHARSISFSLSGKRKKSIEAPYPQDFKNAIERFRSEGAAPPPGLRLHI